MTVDRIQTKTARLRLIEHRLYHAPPTGLRVVDLAQHCGVDRRTIYRDLQTLDDMGIPVWENSGRYGIVRDRYLSTVRLSINEAVAIYFAARLLSHHSDEHNPHVVSALRKLADSLPDTTIAQHITHAAEIIRSRPLRREYTQVLECITRAWADRQKIKIRYRASNGEVTERVICPYFVEVTRREPGAYVIAFDDLRAARRTFKIERIVTAEVLSEGYNIPDDFDPYAQLALAWGVMDEAEVEVRLRFSATVAHRVRENTWHPSQQLTELANGGCDIRLRVGGIREVRSWVLSWGGEVEVLAPTELREEVRTEALKMLQRYQ